MLELDSFQRVAVTSQSHDLSVVAPAGSGKTRVLVERVRWLIERRKVRPGQILVLTFAKRAAKELSQRLQAAGCRGVSAQTFHAWAYQQVRSARLWPGQLLLDGERSELLKRICIDTILTNRSCVQALCLKENWSEPFLVRQVVSVIENVRQAGVSLAHPSLVEAGSTDRFVQFVGLVGNRFQKLLERNGVADFSSLIAQALQVSGTRASSPFRRMVQPEHVLVDEVQDANPQELALVRHLCRMGHRTWVGDPNQALYGWRGAAGEVPHLASTCSLVWNYRSTPQVVALVNNFTGQVPGTVPMRAHRADGPAPSVIYYPRYGEARLVAQLIKELQQLCFKAQDILILARAHVPLEQLLEIRARNPRVRFATVHAVKGLEARAVVVLGVAESRFGFPIKSRGAGHPLIQKIVRYDQAKEERNVFYVAATRARDRLVLCVPSGQTSPFLDGISRALARRVTLAST